jgi:hypothetical protein
MKRTLSLLLALVMVAAFMVVPAFGAAAEAATGTVTGKAYVDTLTVPAGKTWAYGYSETDELTIDDGSNLAGGAFTASGTNSTAENESISVSISFPEYSTTYYVYTMIDSIWSIGYVETDAAPVTNATIVMNFIKTLDDNDVGLAVTTTPAAAVQKYVEDAIKANTELNGITVVIGTPELVPEDDPNKGTWKIPVTVDDEVLSPAYLSINFAGGDDDPGEAPHDPATLETLPEDPKELFELYAAYYGYEKETVADNAYIMQSTTNTTLYIDFNAETIYSQTELAAEAMPKFYTLDGTKWQALKFSIATLPTDGTTLAANEAFAKAVLNKGATSLQFATALNAEGTEPHPGDNKADPAIPKALVYKFATINARPKLAGFKPNYAPEKVTQTLSDWQNGVWLPTQDKDTSQTYKNLQIAFSTGRAAGMNI